MSAALPPIRLQAIGAGDLDFLRRVYASTRSAEMALVQWSDEQKAYFLASQFAAQHEHYQQHYADASFDLVLLNDQPVGRYYVQRRENEFILIDIAFLPDYRYQGLGSQLLQALLREARGCDLPIHLHVEQDNPARAWYQRNGFQVLEERGLYLYMEYRL